MAACSLAPLAIVELVKVIQRRLRTVRIGHDGGEFRSTPYQHGAIRADQNAVRHASEQNTHERGPAARAHNDEIYGSRCRGPEYLFRGIPLSHPLRREHLGLGETVGEFGAHRLGHLLLPAPSVGP